MSLHIVVGISLGGHAAWHCLLHVPDICGGVVIIGCPDYLRLMIERAQQSDIPILTSHTGKRQLNPEYFPQYLLDAIAQSDPAALLTGHNKSSDIEFKEYNAAIEVESSRLQQMRKLRGKKILSISGGADKLVPYSCVQPFLAWLQQAVSKEGCLSNDGISLRLVLEKDTGHEMTPNAAVEVTRFVTEILTEDHQDNSIISRI